MRENDDFITDRKTLTEEIERITGNIVGAVTESPRKKIKKCVTS